MVAPVVQQDTPVIDDELLAQAIIEGEADGKEKMRTVGLADLIMQVNSLRLSFRNLRNIDNLNGFKTLTKLCLDNNKLTKIENLGCLPNLVWLDLSFNKISIIEGLDKLTKLADLSLCDNNLEVIQNLNNSTNLQCLSVGRNNIKSFDNVIYLRKFENLRLLNLEGNPICKEADYRMLTIAYLDFLKYLDYSMIRKDEVDIAKEQFQSELLDLEKKDAVEKDRLEQERASIISHRELGAANLLVCDTITSDLTNIPEMNKIKSVPIFNELTDNFKLALLGLIDVYKSNGLTKFELKSTQIVKYEKMVAELRHQGEANQRALVENFIREKKRTLNKLSERIVPNPATGSIAEPLTEEDLTPLRNHLEGLFKEILSQEIRQSDQTEELLDSFETKYLEIKAHFLDIQQQFFRSVEEAEGKYTRETFDYGAELVEQSANDTLPDDIDEEVEGLLSDKDQFMELLNNAHDNRMSVIFKREGESKANEEKKFNEMLTRYREEENIRNRNRVLELHNMVDKAKSQLDAIYDKSIEEDYDDADAS